MGGVAARLRAGLTDTRAWLCDTRTGYYERLIRLYRSLGVELQLSNFDYAFGVVPGSARVASLRDGAATVSVSESQKQQRPRTTFIYNGNNGLSLRPISLPSPSPSPAAQRSAKAAPSSQPQPAPLLPWPTFVPSWASCRLDFFALALLYAGSYVYLLLLSLYHVKLSTHTSSPSGRAREHWVARSTLRHFCARTRLPNRFVHDILVPLLSCVTTCSPNEVLDDYPAAELLEYVARTFGTDHYVVKGGVRNVVTALLRKVPEENIHLGCELVDIRPARISHGAAGTRRPSVELEDSQGVKRVFDHVIFATQANQARTLLRYHLKHLRDAPDADPATLEYEQRRIDDLAKFLYTQSLVVNHWDADATLPASPADRRILNLLSPERASRAVAGEEKEGGSGRDELCMPACYTMATHDLSRLDPALVHPETGVPVLQSTNPTVAIARDTVLSSQRFERAKVTLESRRILPRFLDVGQQHTGDEERCNGQRGDGETTAPRRYQGHGGFWFVGAWAAEGIPLLEGCVSSAERVCEAIRREELEAGRESGV